MKTYATITNIKKRALIEYLQDQKYSYSEIIGAIRATERSFDSTSFECDGMGLLILDEDERDEYASDSIQNYIDHLVPDNLRPYFDNVAFIRDRIINDGYGLALSSYDGREYEYEVKNTWFYVYRTN